MSGTSKTTGLGHRRIAVIAVDGAYPGSMTGVFDVVLTLNRHMRDRNASTRPDVSPRQGMFSVRLLSPGGGEVVTAGKLRMAVDGSIESSREKFDIVMLPVMELGRAQQRENRLAELAKLGPWLRQQRERGAVFVAQGGGIMGLAEAGILDDHVATVPIGLEPYFRRRYPKVRLDMTQSIVVDRDTICAAALADTLRLVWRALEHFRPGLLSAQTALDLFFHDQDARSGTPRSLPALEELGNPLIDRAKYQLNEWLSQHVSGTPDLDQLAHALAVSPRTLFRRFKAATGMTPNIYLQSLRVEMAKGALRMTDLSIDKIAARAGYANRAYFCKVFRKHAGLTPRTFRTQSRR